jgi:hypothetical protein
MKVSSACAAIAENLSLRLAGMLLFVPSLAG